MTEFKKVSELVATVRDAVAAAEAASSVTELPDAAVLSSVVEQLERDVPEAVRRAFKLYGKATEVDPLKQVYNETMCQKIVELFDVSLVKEVLSRLISDEAIEELSSRQWATDDVRAALMRDSALVQRCQRMLERHAALMTQNEAWTRTTESSIQDVRSRESVGRLALLNQYRTDCDDLVSLMTASRKRARHAEEDRETQRWRTEMSRREEELARLALRATGPGSIGSLFRCVDADVEGTRGRQHRQDALLRLAQHLHALVGALLSHPERQEIRTLRYVASTIEHFGHPCVAAHSDDVGGCAPSITCCCPELVGIAEAVWFCIGFRPQYRRGPTEINRVIQWIWFPPEVAKEQQAPHGCSREEVAGATEGLRVRPLQMPCGEPAARHHYVTPLGFEPYAERTWSLEEPNPAVDAEAWCEWLDNLTATHDALEDLCFSLTRP